jgi:Lrp/AsnC family leucine-responsive transcriptional regulator
LPRLDALDLSALARLAADGRVTWAELASELGLSPAAAAERVRRLERQGVIRGYAAIVEPAALGLGLTALVGVTLARHRGRPVFLRRIQQLAEIQECHHVTGDYDYLLKVRCADTLALERLINDQLKDEAGVAETRTLIVLSTAKETSSLPMPSASAARPRRRRPQKR